MKYLGVDYYPEQWGIEHLRDDLKSIQELGCNVIRIADFAWDIFEPEEGRYDFAFFDEVLKTVKEYGLHVIMCIPTATMPVWLYERYPEIMNEDETGYRQPFGARRGYCFNSEVYMEKARALTRELITHYKGNDVIVAWQMDNEIGHEGSDMCYCESCKKAFHSYLEEKYDGDIRDLNERWGTHFWSHTYSSFKQIPLPRKAFVAQNPTLRLEWERFRSLSSERFIQMEYETIKETDPNIPVIHDFSGGAFNKHQNPFAIAKHMDIVAYNNYPVWGGQSKAMEDYEIAFTLDFAHSFKHQNFWVTEAIMGAQGHDIIGKAPSPRQAIGWSRLAVEHGAESNIFFRYRGYNRGAEQYCFGIVDADNEKRRRYQETQQYFQLVKDAMPPLKKKEACILYDYDSAAAFRIQRQSDTMSYEGEALKLYKQFFDKGISVEFVQKDEDLSGYAYIVLPAMIIMDGEFKKKLKAAAKEGATVLMTFRTGWKDIDNNMEFGKRLPADLDDLCGAVLEEHEALLTDQYLRVEYKGIEGKAEVFEECMTLRGGEAIISYKNSPFGEYAAVVRNPYGKGVCYYLGTSLEEKLLSMLIDDIIEERKQ